MKIKIMLWMISIAIALILLLFYSNQKVKVIAGFQNKWTATVIVNHLPLTNTGKIRWWQEHHQHIAMQYHLQPDNPRGYLSYYIYAFAEGYKANEDEDRLCFDALAPPKNCIDKNLLMVISRDRNGNTQITIGNHVYSLDDARSSDVAY